MSDVGIRVGGHDFITTADQVAHLLERVAELEELVDWLLKHKTRKVHYELMDYAKECPPPPKRKEYPLKTARERHG